MFSFHNDFFLLLFSAEIPALGCGFQARVRVHYAQARAKTILQAAKLQKIIDIAKFMSNIF